jgi:hypothetical protein
MQNLTDKKTARVAVIAVAGLGIVIATLLAMLFMTSGNRDAGNVEAPGMTPRTTTAAVAVQQSLDGQWVAENNGIKMTATVVHDTITVELVNNDTTINFWDGSFESFAQVGDVIGSVRTTAGDTIMVSSDQEKNFIVGDGTISFDLAFMGVTKHIKATHV